MLVILKHDPMFNRRGVGLKQLRELISRGSRPSALTHAIARDQYETRYQRTNRPPPP